MSTSWTQRTAVTPSAHRNDVIRGGRNVGASRQSELARPPENREAVAAVLRVIGAASS